MRRRSRPERAASRVKGVRAIAQEIEVRYLGHDKTDDAAIAEKALRLLSWNTMLPANRITIKVAQGWITGRHRGLAIPARPGRT